MTTPSAVFRHSFLICPMLFAGNAPCAQLRSIDLLDGSVVVGEIVTAGNGIYTVKTARLGIITLKDSDIVAIRLKDVAPGQDPSIHAPPSTHAESLPSVREKIMGNRTLIQSVNALKDDPDIQKILQDPELMKAIQDGNVEALKENPKIQNLMNNPTVQAIYQSLGQ